MVDNTSAVVQTFRGPQGLIEAAQFTDDTALAVIEWAEIPSSRRFPPSLRCFPAGEGFVNEVEDGFVVITTRRGDERVEPGHWIIRDAAGEFDQMTADEFSQANFHPVEKSPLTQEGIRNVQR